VTTRPILGALEQRDRPTPPEQRTVNVDVEQVEARGRTVVGYAAVYGAESEDLGGFRERIAPGAFTDVLSSDVRCLLNHDPNVVLGRTRSGTLRLSDDERGLRFEVDLPESRSDVAEAVRRGDLDGASFRFRADRDSWAGDVRTVEHVAELRDVTLATYAAYPAASVELRTRPNPEVLVPRGGLHVDARRSTSTPAGLAEAFRAAGFPGERAELPFDQYEQRAVTWTGSLDSMAPARRQGSPLAADARWVWPALARVGVDAGTTSVDVVRQSARALATPANMNRAIDATTPKPETSSTIEIVSVALRQLASVQSGISNVYLEQPAINSIIEGDLRLALNEAIDAMAVAALAGSPNVDPSTDPVLVAIRKGITALRALGYAPDTLVVDPATDEALDTLRATAGDEIYVFSPGQAAPSVWNLNRRVSKAAPAPVVMDANAFGRLYAAPVSLARFEENDGATNTSLIRLETHGVVGVERADAAVRIAAT
jgi:HK97 family phage prohead protease